MRDDRHSESGSVLIYILVAISLFMALNMAFVQMQRGGGKPPDEEKLGLWASEIMQYTSGLQRAIRMMRIDGLEYTELSFENNFTVADYSNAGCVVDACRVFLAGGGGMAYQAPFADWLAFASAEWYFPGNLCVENVGSDTGACQSDGLSNEEVVIILSGIRENLCTVINEKLEITGIPQETGNGWNTGDIEFTGDESDGEILEQTGQRRGCFEGSGANTPPVGTYHYFHVLWAR